MYHGPHDKTEAAYRGFGISCTAQRLPSGSAKKTNRPQGKSWMSLTVDAARRQLRRGGLDVGDHDLQPLHRAGLGLGDPLPIAIEQAEPGRRQLHEAQVVADRWSWSALKPTLSM